VGDHALNVYTGPDALVYRFKSQHYSTHFVILWFVPRKPYQAVPLSVVINHTPLAGRPFFFTIEPEVVGEFKDRLFELRKYLRARHCIGYTPTLTLRRDMLLESAVQAVQGHHFSRTLRIRFGDEPGIDMGGIVRWEGRWGGIGGMEGWRERERGAGLGVDEGRREKEGEARGRERERERERGRR
jgi:hypothetical protein